MKHYKYLFGPVLSRRLGLSLGVDLLPYKTCSFDCVYCECRATTALSLTRREFFPLEEVCAELRDYLGSGPLLDYVTFSGSGEPTLYSRLEELIDFLKAEFPQYRLALLTNATLLPRAEVRHAIRRVDLCVPSLDSATQQGFERIDRPAPQFHLQVAEIIEGIRKTREELAGELWLEIFIVPGINDTRAELLALRRAVEDLGPHKVQINSLDRPGTEDWVQGLSAEEKAHISHYLRGQILAVKDRRSRQFNQGHDTPTNTIKGRLLALLRQKPLSREELCRYLDMTAKELDNVLYTLLAKRTITADKETGKIGISGQSRGA